MDGENDKTDVVRTQEGITVGTWRQKYLNESLMQNPKSRPSDYASYIYDAVWTYAFALDELVRRNHWLPANLHTTAVTESVESRPRRPFQCCDFEFFSPGFSRVWRRSFFFLFFCRSLFSFAHPVTGPHRRTLSSILKTTNFTGVSGQVNFAAGPSRLSEIRVVQWLDRELREIGTFPAISNLSSVSNGTWVRGALRKSLSLSLSLLDSFSSSAVKCRHSIDRLDRSRTGKY